MAPTARDVTPPGDTAAVGAALISAVAGESDEELDAGMGEDRRQMTAAHARYLLRLGEFDRRQAFRNDGATSVGSWSIERFGVSVATARADTLVAERAQDLPHLVGSLREGEISFDKIRAVLNGATPETDQELCDMAKEHSVRELAEVARSTAARARSASFSQSRSEHDGRYLRFNDGHRTMSLQLPQESYAQTKACVDAFVQNVPSEGETPLDQRRCDGFTAIIDSVTPGHGATSTSTTRPTTDTSSTPSAPSPFFVVAHVPLEALVDPSAQPSELAGELEHHGLIDVETIQRIACDATVVVAVDDSLGHTMYEGRARRFPSGAQKREVIRRDRQCRFPGCANATFVAVHHIVPWKLGGGTDLDNLILLCKNHHGRVHRNGWSMTGNPNEELRVVGPSGRVMVSRPSPIWTRVKAGWQPAGPN